MTMRPYSPNSLIKWHHDVNIKTPELSQLNNNIFPLIEGFKCPLLDWIGPLVDGFQTFDWPRKRRQTFSLFWIHGAKTLGWPYLKNVGFQVYWLLMAISCFLLARLALPVNSNSKSKWLLISSTKSRDTTESVIRGVQDFNVHTIHNYFECWRKWIWGGHFCWVINLAYLRSWLLAFLCY